MAFGPETNVPYGRCAESPGSIAQPFRLVMIVRVRYVTIFTHWLEYTTFNSESDVDVRDHLSNA